LIGVPEDLEPNPATELMAEGASLDELHLAAEGCRACELYRQATQVVFGAGPAPAPLMLVGEQPGDVEDREGEPFVGPAGAVLAECLAEAGVSVEDVYVTNVVKHFRWEPRGKRRIHKTPGTRHVRTCIPWLEAELAVVDPVVIVCLGAVASQALLGRSFRVTKQRGQAMEWGGRTVVATIHPSAVLRADPDVRDTMRASLVEDLITALRLIG
jgi:DNA polymerase